MTRLTRQTAAALESSFIVNFFSRQPSRSASIATSRPYLCQYQPTRPAKPRHHPRILQVIITDSTAPFRPMPSTSAWVGVLFSG